MRSLRNISTINNNFKFIGSYMFRNKFNIFVTIFITDTASI